MAAATTNRLITQFRLEGPSKLTETECVSLLTHAENLYYNGGKAGSPLSDNEYDLLKEYVARKYPTNAVLKRVGAMPKNDDQKVSLPFPMPSMDKIKPDTNALDKWMSIYKGHYVISCKLDGISALYTGTHLYTRGNTTVGRDISAMLPFLRLPPLPLSIDAVRGELIIPRADFARFYKDKYANARSQMSGLVGLKPSSYTKDLLKHVHFVAYETMCTPQVNAHQQLAMATEAGFETVDYTFSSALSNDLLSEHLKRLRDTYTYDMDGLIICHSSAVYSRSVANPRWAFAFKMILTDQQAEAKVIAVHWTAGRSGIYAPRVELEPVRIGGSTIRFANGFNGRFIWTNRVGVGATVLIVRSGDVIPDIQEVIVPATEPTMPKDPYVWNATHVHIMVPPMDLVVANGAAAKQVAEKRLLHFVASLDLAGFGPGIVGKLFHGGINTVGKLVSMTVDDGIRLKVPMAVHLIPSIHTRLNTASLTDLFVAVAPYIFKSGGCGRTRLDTVIRAFPNLMDPKVELSASKLAQLSGIGADTAHQLALGIPIFRRFVKEQGLTKYIRVPSTAVTEGKGEGPVVAMTKVRDAEITEFVKAHGGTIAEHMRKDVSVLIIKSRLPEDSSEKTRYAEKHGIPMVTVAEFKQKYMAA